ncbi:MAG TPA: TIR domain-containing protein [Polyangiales bacterium]
MSDAGYEAFVCYDHADRDSARSLKELLQAFGKHVFLDRDGITRGGRWDDATRRAAHQAESVLIVWSRNAQRSACLKEELALMPPTARVMPVRLDDSELPEGLIERAAFAAQEVPERIIARTQTLLAEGLTRGDAVERILQELSKDAVRPEQRRAVRAFVFGFNVASPTALAKHWLREWAVRNVTPLATPRFAGVALAAALLAAPLGYLLAQARGSEQRASYASKLEAVQAERVRYERTVQSELESVRQQMRGFQAEALTAQTALESAKLGLGDQSSTIAKLTQQKLALETSQRALLKEREERERAHAARESELLAQLQTLTEENQSLSGRNEVLASHNATLEARNAALETQNEKSSQALASAVRRLAANPPVLEPARPENLPPRE